GPARARPGSIRNSPRTARAGRCLRWQPRCRRVSRAARTRDRRKRGDSAACPSTKPAPRPEKPPLRSRLWWACAPTRLLRERLHGLLQAADRGRVHAVVHEFLHDLDRLAVGPDFLGLRVEPDALRIDVGEALDPHRAGFLVEVLDRAARLQDLIGTHGRVADEDHLVVVAVLVQQLPGAGALRVAAAVVLPDEVVQAVVEIVELEV